MKLNLKKPLVFFDLETTGVNVGTDRIVEIAMVKVMPDGSLVTKPEKPGKAQRILINPEIPIPIESSLVHGVYDEDVKDAPTFKQLSKGIFKFLHGCDLGGFNSNRFDIPMLAEEFLRVGIDFSMEGRNLIDAQVIYHLMEQRTLKAAYRFYCNRDLEGAHEALPDTMATYEVFMAMMERYEGQEVIDAKGVSLPKFENDMESIHKFCNRNKFADLIGRFVYDEQGEVLFNFGKHSGKPVREVLQSEKGYYSWMMNGDFPLYTKKVLTDVKESL